MKRHTSNTRDNLGELAGLAERTKRTEERILKQAEKRLADVQASLERARPGIEAAPDAAQQRYQDLVAERGTLHQVIAKAKAVLA